MYEVERPEARPLFGQKIKIDRKLKIIGDDIIGEFDAIREIRNEFAHRKENIFTLEP
jgi:hypothetical protein